jgi:hypothetical protein
MEYKFWNRFRFRFRFCQDPRTVQTHYSRLSMHAGTTSFQAQTVPIFWALTCSENRMWGGLRTCSCSSGLAGAYQLVLLLASRFACACSPPARPPGSHGLTLAAPRFTYARSLHTPALSCSPPGLHVLALALVCFGSCTLGFGVMYSPWFAACSPLDSSAPTLVLVCSGSYALAFGAMYSPRFAACSPPGSSAPILVLIFALGRGYVEYRIWPHAIGSRAFQCCRRTRAVEVTEVRTFTW